MISKSQLLTLENSSCSQEAGNYLRMTKEELLKKLYYDLKNPVAYTGKSKLLQEIKKHESNISIDDIGEWLKSQLAFTLYKTKRLNFKIRPIADWQIDLVDMNKLSKLKVGLSPSKKICVICLIESPLKMMKNAFYFILEALFVLKLFKFLSRLFGHVGKTA